LDDPFVDSGTASNVTYLAALAFTAGLCALVTCGMIRLLRGLGNPYGLTTAQRRLVERRAFVSITSVVIGVEVFLVLVLGLPK
jgi:hypothetical protein